jgi:cytidine deaminase
MNKELIMKLIERAKSSSDHAYVPFTNNPIGCALLADENLIFGGCNIENSALNCSADAGEVAVLKAISEGYTTFRAICFYSAAVMPFPSGKVRQLLAEFNQTIQIVTATEDTYSMNTLNELLPFAPETPSIE